jgi:hypothetical protein
MARKFYWRKVACGAFREHVEQRFSARGLRAPAKKRGFAREQRASSG